MTLTYLLVSRPPQGMLELLGPYAQGPGDPKLAARLAGLHAVGVPCWQLEVVGEGQLARLPQLYVTRQHAGRLDPLGVKP